MIDKEQIKAIIKQYADKGKKMYSEAIDSRGSRYNAGFWDGYECCAKGLLRELEDMQEEPTIPDIVDEHFYEMLGEESVSEDKDKITYQGKEYIRCYHDELDEFANKYPKTVPPPEKRYAKYSDVDMVIAVKVGAEWQMQQFLANAIDAVVKIDAGGYPYVDRTIELYDYDKDIPLAKRGDKVKIFLIKE